jgi:hypothetical protein
MISCNSSDEMHHNRHKEILKIVRQISTLDMDQASLILPSGKVINEGKVRRESAITTSTCTTTDSASESTGIEDTKQTRRERKRCKKSGGSAMRVRSVMESFTTGELDFVSEALHLTIHESKGGWQGTYVYDHKQEPLEYWPRIGRDKSSTPELDIIPSSIHDFAVKSPHKLTPRQRKILKKYSTPTNHSGHGGGSRKFSPHALIQEVVDEFDGVNPAIFFRLGVEIINPIKNSKARKDLVGKLIAAVKEDLEIITREDQEIEMRAEGFWRWAGKTAWHVIKETRENLDWATGQKIREPRPEAFVDDGTGVYFPDVDKAELHSPDSGPHEIPCQEREVNIEDPLLPSPKWETVTSKKSEVAEKKARCTKSTLMSLGSVELIEPVVVEDGNKDMHEMVMRYQQRMAGERNIGHGMTTKSNHRTGPRKLTLKLN